MILAGTFELASAEFKPLAKRGPVAPQKLGRYYPRPRWRCRFPHLTRQSSAFLTPFLSAASLPEWNVGSAVSIRASSRGCLLTDLVIVILGLLMKGSGTALALDKRWIQVFAVESQIELLWAWWVYIRRRLSVGSIR